MYEGFVVSLSREETFFDHEGRSHHFFEDLIREKGEEPLKHCLRNRYQTLVVTIEKRPQTSLHCVVFITADGDLNLSVGCNHREVLALEAEGYTEVRNDRLVHSNFKIFGSLQTFCNEETERALWDALKEMFALDAQSSQSADISYKKALSARPWWRKLLGLPPART